MKRFIIIVLLLGVSALVIAAVSFFINDRDKLKNSAIDLSIIEDIKEQKAFSNIENFDKEENFDVEIKELYIEKLNGGLLIKQSNYDGIKITNGKKGNIDYSFENCKLIIDDKGGETDIISIRDLFKNNYRRTIVYSKNPEELVAKIINLNGAMSVDTNINALTIEEVNGALGIDSKESFNIKISEINGAANIKMENFDANIKINSINGAISTFFENEKSNIFPKKIDEKIKNGRNTIEIGTVNGAISIDN